MKPSPQPKKSAPRPAVIPTPRRAFDWNRVLPFAALCALTLAAYANSFQAGLVYDNALIIGQDARLQAVSAHNIGLIFSDEYWFPHLGNGLYRPFTTLTYLFNYSVLGNGVNPFGYHLLNFILQSANACLIFLVGLTLFAEAVPAFAMAAIWTVHPVLTESVTNIVGRADELAAIGVLAALICFIRARESVGRQRISYWIGCAAAATVGIFSKESAIVVIGVVLLFVFSFPRRQRLRDDLIGVFAVTAPCLLYLLVRHAVLAASPILPINATENPIEAASFWPAKLTAIEVIGREIALLFWPMKLSADYSYNAIPVATGLTPPVLFGLGVLTALLLLAAWGWVRSRKTFFLILFALGSLLPTSNLLFSVGTIMAERFLYLPAIAFAGCVAALLWSWRERLSVNGVRVVFAVIVLVFTVRAFARNFDWYTPDSLFSSTEQTVPESFRPHHVLAGIYQTAGKVDDAIREADQSTRILSSLPDDQSLALPWVTAASIYAAKASSLSASDAATWWNRALDAVHRARQIAVAQDVRVRRIDAEYGKPYHAADTRMIYENLGYVEMRTRNFDRSIEAIQTAMRQGLATNTFINLATGYRGKGDQRNAEITLLEGMLWGKDNSFGSRVVELYRQGGSASCAIKTDGNSVGLNTACPLVSGELCEAASRLLPLLESQGQTADASRVQTEAQRLGCSK